MASGGSYYLVDGKRVPESEYLKRKSKPAGKAKTEAKPKSGKPEPDTTKSSED